MEKSNIMIRLEKKEEHQKVENLVRESFWNVYCLGCLEHYVLHQLRNDPAFVPELDFVMLLNENGKENFRCCLCTFTGLLHGCFWQLIKRQLIFQEGS